VLLLEIDIGQRVAVVILDDEAGIVRLLDGPRWREAAGGRHVRFLQENLWTRRVIEDPEFGSGLLKTSLTPTVRSSGIGIACGGHFPKGARQEAFQFSQETLPILGGREAKCDLMASALPVVIFCAAPRDLIVPGLLAEL
jgi:hypothetical protein